MGFDNYDKFMKQANELIKLKADLRKIVEEMRNVQKYDLNDNETTKYWADRIEQLLNREGE